MTIDQKYIERLKKYKAQMPFYARKLKIPKLFKKYEDSFAVISCFSSRIGKKEDAWELTIDKMIETLDMMLICKELVQPYERGLGT